MCSEFMVMAFTFWYEVRYLAWNQDKNVLVLVNRILCWEIQCTIFHFSMSCVKYSQHGLFMLQMPNIYIIM